MIKKEIPVRYNKKNILAEIGDLISDKQKQFMKTQLIPETLSFIDFALFNIEHPIK
jgi:transposase